jgi:hypothetical protein
MYWNGPSWPLARYRASTLQQSNNQEPAAAEPTFYPDWLEGYHAITYKFDKASFPQGKKILSLRAAGAGLGTCMVLPNVGYNPPVHATHFLRGGKQDLVYEDLAYNDRGDLKHSGQKPRYWLFKQMATILYNRIILE